LETIFTIFKSKQINSISGETITNYDKPFDENYHLSDNDKSKLKNIVDQYTEHFIIGIPSTRVTTGELEIRLLDANKTVQRRECKVHLYADDVQIYVGRPVTEIHACVRISNKMLSLVEKWAKENVLGINPKKSKCLVIGKKPISTLSLQKLYINHTPISWG